MRKESTTVPLPIMVPILVEKQSAPDVPRYYSIPRKVGFALCTRQADGMVMSVAALVYLVPVSAARTLRFDVGLYISSVK